MRLKAITLAKPEMMIAPQSTHVDTGAPSAAAECNYRGQQGELREKSRQRGQAAHEEHATDEYHAEEGHGCGDGDPDVLATAINGGLLDPVGDIGGLTGSVRAGLRAMPADRLRACGRSSRSA